MPWEARLVVIKKDTLNLQTVTVDVVYYDTNAPAVTLHTKRFEFPVNATNAQMRQEVVEEGQRARATFDRSKELIAAFPEGTTISIPVA